MGVHIWALEQTYHRNNNIDLFFRLLWAFWLEIRQKCIANGVEFARWASKGPNTPGAGVMLSLVLIVVIICEWSGGGVFRWSRFHSSISRATPVASAKELGLLILTSKHISSLRVTMKHPIKKFSSNLSTLCDNFLNAFWWATIMDVFLSQVNTSKGSSKSVGPKWSRIALVNSCHVKGLWNLVSHMCY